MKVYYDKDADLSLVKGKKIAIVGTGRRARPRPEPARLGSESHGRPAQGRRLLDKAKKAGLNVEEVSGAVKGPTS